jgi:hypothetical protein
MRQPYSSPAVLKAPSHLKETIMKKTVTTISSVALMAMLATLSAPAVAANESPSKNPALRQKAQELQAKHKADRKALNQAEAELKNNDTQAAKDKVEAAKAQVKTDRKEMRGLRKEARAQRGPITDEQRIEWRQQRAEGLRDGHHVEFYHNENIPPSPTPSRR